MSDNDIALVCMVGGTVLIGRGTGWLSLVFGLALFVFGWLWVETRA